MLLARYMNWNRPCSTLWRRLRLQEVKMRNDAINMEINEGLLAFFAEEEGAVGGVVHEEVFGEDGRAGGMAEEVEVGFLVGVGIGRTLDQGTIGPYIPIGLHPFPNTYTHLSTPSTGGRSGQIAF